MSDIPDVAKLMLSKRIKKQMEFKERKILEINKLNEGEWKTIKPLWSEHFDQEKQKKCDLRNLYIDEYGACIIMLISLPFNPKIASNGKYYDSFECLLLSNDEDKAKQIPGVKKYIKIWDHKEKLFEDWYFKNGVPLIRIAWLRGELKVKHRDMGDKKTWGVSLEDYLKSKDKKNLSELDPSYYERIFELSLWEILETLNTGVD